MVELSGAARYVLYFTLTIILVANILFVVFFKLVRLIEWLSFALKVTNDSHYQLKRRKQSIDVKDNSQPCTIEGVENIITKIKCYSRKPYDHQYEEYCKQRFPRLFHILEWVSSAIHRRIVAKVKSRKQPNANNTNSCLSISCKRLKRILSSTTDVRKK